MNPFLMCICKQQSVYRAGRISNKKENHVYIKSRENNLSSVTVSHFNVRINNLLGMSQEYNKFNEISNEKDL